MATRCILGGGRGPLTSTYGMGADQALNFEIVTAEGNVVKANAQENPDLFWVLKRGGAGDFWNRHVCDSKNGPPDTGCWCDPQHQFHSHHRFRSLLGGCDALHPQTNTFVDNYMFVY